MGQTNAAERKRGQGPGPSSRHVAENLKSVRKSLGVDLRELAARTKKLRRPLSTSGISRIENGDRRIDVDDLFVLALALDTTPSHLLVPNPNSESPTGTPDAFLWEEVQAWIGGRIELTSDGLLGYWEEQEAKAISFRKQLEKGIEKMESGQWSGKMRRSYETRLDEQAHRIELAKERQSFADSLSSSDSQYAVAIEVLKDDDNE